MDDNLIKRINELSKKSKTVGLSEEEKKEQASLRSEYISCFKSNLKSTLDSVVIIDKNGKQININNKKKNTKK